MSSYKEGQAHQVMEALERAGYTPEDLTKMGQSQEQLKAFRGVLRHTQRIERVRLLEYIDTIDLPALPRLAIDREFAEEHKWCAFEASFSDSFDMKSDGPTENTRIQVRRLDVATTDLMILGEIGTNNIAFTICHLFALLEKQKNGEGGVLLTKGENILYVYDSATTYCAVRAYYWDRRWCLSAHSVHNSEPWREESQIIFRSK